MALLKRFLPHILVVIGFIIASLAYFNPVLSGKKMLQNDIVQYTGMAKQQIDFRAQTGEEPFWTDSAFGGMPTYQLGAQYPHHYIKNLDRIIRFLPRPADYLFLYFIGFYILLLVLKVDYKLAFIGSLAFGFSTYFIIILGVGHNAKAHAIGYMPLVLSGILLIFRKKYSLGFILLTLSMALEIAANHFQMTYYLLLLVIVLGIAYLVDAYRKKVLPAYFKAIGIMVGAVLLSLLLNATSLMATREYTQYSTRGDTGITITPTGSIKEEQGLDYGYITEYSYGILETFNVFIPRFMGGSASEEVDDDAEIIQELYKMGATPDQAKMAVQQLPTYYWGDQPYVGAPAYIGATVIFLFVLGIFLIRGRLKWWLVGGVVLSLVLSWGKNLDFVTRFFVEYVPLYNKFRAVSSIQVIAELCMPVLAIVGLCRFFDPDISKEQKIKGLKYATAIVGGLALIFLLFKNVFLDFSGPMDRYLIDGYGPDFVRALKEDRKSVFTSDTIRSLVLILLLAASCWAFMTNKLQRVWVITIIGVLFIVDLTFVNWDYVNSDNFISKRAFDRPFVANKADKDILKDTGHFRVYDLSANPFNSARASYFHNALGGYHAAKPGRVRDLYEFYIAKGDVDILNMFNVKYFILADEEQGPMARINDQAYGNAWFVQSLKEVTTANDEILALEDLALQSSAVVNTDQQQLYTKTNFNLDGMASIKLTSHQPNELVYQTNNSNEGFAVFSEIYYPGWQAYIDGKPVDHLQVNYTLRGLQIPKGSHTVTFTFEPAVVQQGSLITLISSVLFVVLLIGLVFYRIKQGKLLLASHK
ncbi:YfhO family protein [Aquimarina brevivitae]|uniref:Membrane protein YfhO n=1 Tax=Aquimarina brevivitae TaxID=323412 RepID=A0A4Q7P2K2_9FLAO|nr:YfhO family protein [Aquimarina brevivitae]RZS93610.1 membrane protein YfhO [Aquimarina brevivitae]